MVFVFLSWLILVINGALVSEVLIVSLFNDVLLQDFWIIKNGSKAWRLQVGAKYFEYVCGVLLGIVHTV